MLKTNKTSILNDDEIKALFKRTGERAYDKMLNSERGRQILADADSYGISYNMKNRGIDWLDLIDQIKEYQEMEDDNRGAVGKYRLKHGRDYSYA